MKRRKGPTIAQLQVQIAKAEAAIEQRHLRDILAQLRLIATLFGARAEAQKEKEARELAKYWKALLLWGLRDIERTSRTGKRP